MRKLTVCLIVFALLCVSAHAVELDKALSKFSVYKHGDAKQVLHEARMAAFRNANDHQTRLKHENLLLGFVQSDATVAARREACMWLSDMATDASKPVLSELAKQPEFADVAQIALDAFKAPSEATVDNDLARLKAEILSSKNPDGLIKDAITGNDIKKARVAFYLLETGAVETNMDDWLGKNILKLDSQKQFLTMNVLINSGSADTAKVLKKVAENGEGEARLYAIKNVGASADGLELLVKMLMGEDKGLSNAARDAMLAAPEKALQGDVLRLLNSGDSSLQAAGIYIAETRGLKYAADALWKIAEDESNPNRGDAVKALGSAAPLSQYSRILEALIGSVGSPAYGNWKIALKNASFRMPDYDKAIAVLSEAKGQAPADLAKTLDALSGKLKQLKPIISVERAKAPTGHILLPGSYKDIVPERFEVAAYMNCGPESSVSKNGIAIHCINGKPYNSGQGTDPSLSVSFAGPLNYSITGLDNEADYVIGFTWWDIDFKGRRQAIAINGVEVLPDTRAIGFEERGGNTVQSHGIMSKLTPIRIQFALLPEHIENGTAEVSIRGTAGPNVVNSEIWIAKRREPRAEKQVLLVSGQDFRGHHWRKTGPVMEQLITEDKRMEVTVCETPFALGLKHLDYYDAVFIHFKNHQEDIPATKKMKENLAAYVKNGGGMCLSHFACGAFMEWPEFVELSGRVWNGQGHDRRGPFTVNVVDRDHQITKGLGESFETDDEIYYCLHGEPEVHLLCEAFSKAQQANQPQAITCQPGKGRTFLCTLGHDVRAYEPAKVKQLYRQGTAWAAGLSSITTAENNDGKKKICFVAGKASHGRGTHAHAAGCRLLASALNRMPGVTAVVSENGWPADSSFFDNAAAVVMFSDGGGKHVGKEHWEEIDDMAKKGVGISVLHYATMVDKGKVGDYFLAWLGGYYEPGLSVNPHWAANFEVFPKHPVTRGMKPFTLHDEWYFHMRFRDGMNGVSPVLSAHPPPSTMARPDGPHSGNPTVRAAVKNGEAQHVAWVATRPDGGRGFGFTGAHSHKNWQDENFQKLVLNAVAWTAKVEIPEDGIPVALKN